MNVYMHFISFFIYGLDSILVVVLLDKKTEVLDMMIKHGIMDSLCEIFSTSSDKDTLV